jgi:chemotaxis protein histidine kinase CheA
MACGILPAAVNASMDDDSREELRTLQLDYLLSARETVDLIRQHALTLASRNQFKTAFPVLLYLSHQLKGSGGTLGFPKISDIAGRLSGELNRFLDDAGPRPDPGELSGSMVALSDELDSSIAEAEQALRTHSLIDGT